MSGVETTIARAKRAAARGELGEAEALYTAVLAKFPQNARARQGLEALRAPRPDGAPQPLLDRMIDAFRLGRLDEAARQAEAVLADHPRSAMAHNVLGTARLQLGEDAGAEAALRAAHGLGLRTAGLCSNLGLAIANQGRAAEALACYDEALALDPAHGFAHNNRGNALKACGRLGEALAAYDAAIARQPDFADAHNNRGLVLEALGQLGEAHAAFGRALELEPRLAAAHNNLGSLLLREGDTDGAIACFDRALALVPGFADALFNLGNARKAQGATGAAILAYRQAEAARPGNADTAFERGKALALEERLDEAIAAFAEAQALDPQHAGAAVHRLFYEAHVCDWTNRGAWAGLGEAADAACPPFAALPFEDDPVAQLRRSRGWAASVLPAASAAPVPAAAADGRIRVGYFSADFHDHATMHLLAGVLREHDRGQFEIRAYSYGPPREGPMRELVRAHVDGFHEIGAMAHGEVAALARGHGLDIAVDLKGFTLGNRLALFAQRLAPVQIGYLGYPGSSGADFIDYIVADPVIIPEEARGGYSEAPILLPGSYQPNDDQRAISEGGSRADHGLPEAGLVLCCFNHTYKISPAEWAIWMRALAAAPGSVLWLLRSNRWAEDNLRRAAAAAGIAPGRLVFAGSVPHAEHLGRLAHADLFLDTFNVNAHTTASDALWAGVPVVTRLGRQFAARVGASLLGAVGLPELVAANTTAYEATIRRLIADPAGLAALRARLAANRASQPLFDTVRYTRNLEAGWRAAHARHCAGLAPVPIVV